MELTTANCSSFRKRLSNLEYHARLTRQTYAVLRLSK